MYNLNVPLKRTCPDPRMYVELQVLKKVMLRRIEFKGRDNIQTKAPIAQQEYCSTRILLNKTIAHLAGVYINVAHLLNQFQEFSSLLGRHLQNPISYNHVQGLHDQSLLDTDTSSQVLSGGSCEYGGLSVHLTLV